MKILKIEPEILAIPTFDDSDQDSDQDYPHFGGACFDKVKMNKLD